MHSGMSLRRIADKHGISDACLVYHARKRGWVRIVPTIRLTPGRKPLPPGMPKPRPPSAADIRNRKLVTRLLAALDKGLAQLEARMMPETGAVPVSAADAERDARSLAGFARLYQKLVALDEAARSAGGEGGQATEATDDAGELRRALALRLERLNQARNAG